MSAPLAAVVLCGGRSRRMGVDKATIIIEGVTLLERVTARLRAVADPIMIAARDRAITVHGCPAVDDAVPNAGPVAGLLGALRASPHHLVAAVAVDMPWVDPSLIGLLATRCAGLDACVPVDEQGPQPLHAVYDRSAIAACEEVIAGPDRSLHAVLGRLRCGWITETEWRAAGIAPGFARNLNTPLDLAAVTPPAAQ